MRTTITLELPEEIARQLESKWKDLPRAALESLLGFSTRFAVEEFLKQHGVYDYTLEDLQQDREALRSLPGRS